ncbi:MAG: Protein of unknown function (DUF2851) [Verrucomicrobia bacterium]|nr:MAG: Protein of unknown function (DUF2851) [Verrucomicrobiota bacterium]
MKVRRPFVKGALSGELELQARWFAGEFGRDFCGTEGERVRIVQFGIWNRTAGPDFVEAAVSIDGAEPKRGAIEIDPDVKDWERHGHSQNTDYEGVVLHVFEHRGGDRVFSRTKMHRLIVQVQLSPVENRGLADGALARAGRCAPLLAAQSLEQIRLTLSEAALFRFQRKATALHRTGDAHGENEALYQALAMGMGYPNNQLPFRLLAQRLPLRRLSQDPDGAEALLYGVSGFLPAPDLSVLPLEARVHVRGLWQRWWPHRVAYQSLQVPQSVWRLGGQRPANHPARRVGALSVLVRHWRALRRLVGAKDWKRLAKILCGMTHAFWSHHYTFGSPASPRPIALIGRERLEELLANSLLPFAGDWEKLSTLRTRDHNRRSRIAATRLLALRPDAKKLLSEAVCQQGLLQLYEDFCCCDASDCAHCPFPEQTAAARTIPVV